MQNIVFIAIALVLAITATVLAFVFIVPEKRREKLGAFGKFLHGLIKRFFKATHCQPSVKIRFIRYNI